VSHHHDDVGRKPLNPILPAVFGAASLALFVYAKSPAGAHKAEPGHDVASFKLACVTAGGETLREAENVTGVKLPCPEDAQLAFLVTNKTADAKYAGVIIDTDDRRRWALPSRGEPAFPVPPGSVAIPMRRAFPLSGLSGRTLRFMTALFAGPMEEKELLEMAKSYVSSGGVEVNVTAPEPR
jgi:hypothetical protein